MRYRRGGRWKPEVPKGRCVRLNGGDDDGRAPRRDRPRGGHRGGGDVAPRRRRAPVGAAPPAHARDPSHRGGSPAAVRVADLGAPRPARRRAGRHRDRPPSGRGRRPERDRVSPPSGNGAARSKGSAPARARVRCWRGGPASRRHLPPRPGNRQRSRAPCARRWCSTTGPSAVRPGRHRCRHPPHNAPRGCSREPPSKPDATDEPVCAGPGSWRGRRWSSSVPSSAACWR